MMLWPVLTLLTERIPLAPIYHSTNKALGKTLKAHQDSSASEIGSPFKEPTDGELNDLSDNIYGTFACNH